MQKTNKELLTICILIPIAVGSISSLLSGNGMAAFEQVNQPPLSPPGFIFPVVWTILYTFMGIASYLILTSGGDKKDIRRAITFYTAQLAVNFFWSIFFFRFSWYLFSFLWLLLLWGLILLCIHLFQKISKPAAWLMVPYLLWVTFAGYLNFSIWRLN